MADQDRSPMQLAEAFRELEQEAQRGQADEQQDSRPNTTSRDAADPFDAADPWTNYGGTGAFPPRQGQFTGAVTHPVPGTYGAILGR